MKTQTTSRLLLGVVLAVFFVLIGLRIWRANTPEAIMPMSDRNQAEIEAIYLEPGGAYTRADIEANGRTTPQIKYARFRASHDFRPKPGDALCPVTRTKAHPACTWIVNGQTYQFCCPPCIDEFVVQAKESAEKLKRPEDYVQH